MTRNFSKGYPMAGRISNKLPPTCVNKATSYEIWGFHGGEDDNVVITAWCFTCGYVWVRNLVSHGKGRTQIEGV
jgi:hypothetical protein